ncbi:MAG: T9SS type B sorting domain-containing protein [Flavobacteriaceae bacterium]|nr:T9SS type B sorting domain-containing protein [Flavobacteriaceae bacterium]
MYSQFATNVLNRGCYAYLILAIFLSLSNSTFGQKISIDNSLSAQSLIEDHLVEGCVEVSNISSSINGSVNGFSSFGYFERDMSNFPFENGIVLSTGNAASGGNTTNDNILNDGDLNWGTDPDLEAALGITNTYNATTIEFDFTSISNLIQFDYILASEEYFGNFPCEYSDGFAFLIRESGTSDPYTNIALVPGTAIPVNTNTIHDEIVGFCPAENEEYFDGYTMGDTNFNGRTVVLSASANITPNVQYHIKLVIADQTDQNYDSAVFIQGNSFNPTVELGPDVTTCALDYFIDADIENPLATYAWYENGTLMPAEVNSNLTVTSSGLFQVVITIPLNGSDCIIEDTINVTLNSEQTAEPLPDYELCDDLSGDETETFDLSTMDDDALAAVPPANYNISYHYTLADAQNNINPILTPIQNSTNPQIIFVRIEDIDNGCLAFTNFDLIVNRLPDPLSPNNVQYCDDESADGSTSIDLTALDDGITQGNPNLVVTYHYTQTDADTGANPIPNPYVNTLPNETLYVHVVDTQTGCTNTTSFTIEILDRPVVDENSIPAVNACEADDDGFASFNLIDVIPDILDGLTNVTVTFHESESDANEGINAIADESNYQNTVQNVQTLYVRIEDDTTGCYTIVPLTLHTNLLETGTNVRDFQVCDDDSGDGIAEFDLASIADTIANGHDITITFYETQDDIDNETNALDQTVPYVVDSSPQTLYVNIAVPSCERDVTIDLIINPPIILEPIPPIDYCDDDDDGFTSIDMASLDPFVLNGMTDVTATYFLTAADAQNNENVLPPFYTNTENPQTFHVRVSHDVTACFDRMPIEVNVIAAPEVNDPADIIICDNDQDGYYIIDLDALIPEIVSNTNNLNITFHTNLSDANSDINAIPNTTSFNASTQIIYARVESTMTACHAISEVNVIINTEPAFIDISNFQNCETDGNQIADFLFNEKDDEILNGQTGKEVLYFETENDAINRVNIIDKDLVYNNTSSPQTIYCRVENTTDPDCFGVSSFIIEVGAIPTFNAPTNFTLCDDISNDGFELFDLTEKVDEITSGSTDNLVLSFHTSLEDAENSVNEIDLTYTNVENPQQIYVRIENGNYCHAIAEFGLNVVQVPTVNLPSALVTCDNDYDGLSSFDLTVSEIEILDIRNDDIEVSYYESEDDLETNTNQIPNPSNYTNISNPQTVFVKVLNTQSGCYAELPLELNVNLPPLINPIPEIHICDNDSNTFELNLATDILLETLTNVEYAYFSSLLDAENEQDPLGDTYSYSGSGETIFLRANDTLTNCFRIQSFDLVVNPNPIANTPPDLEACDDDFDYELIFDLSQQDPFVLGGQSANAHTVTYYETLIQAENASNAIQDLNYNAFDGQELFVRLENNSTGCFDTTSFMVIINRKPNVAIEDQVICLDNLPLTVYADTEIETDSYLWSTGETSSEIEIDQIGSYSVTVTSFDGCETLSEFEVIESEPATIEVTETIDFSDPNNITITISGIGNYLYILDDGEPQESNVFENVSLGYHSITVIDLNGCGSVTTEVLVIDAPKFMTPNGDGYFDYWHIVGVETLAGTTINIFDRYGKQLAFLTSTSQGWDGTYNGALMPANDYWYVANVVQGDRQFQIQGHFALRR